MSVVVDWDATCTVADTLELVLLEFGDRRSSAAARRRSCAGRFARDGLAAYLDSRRAEYEPFDDLRDVVAALGR
jgi:2-hydroxy-3-keto-5-methylthiopentenyl-1-phosphate phosphatase